MKKLCIALGLAVTMLTPTAGMAQSEEAVVVRGDGNKPIAWVAFDGDHTLVISSTYPDFSCGTAESVPDRWQVVTIPSGAVHYVETGRFFSRVYDGTMTDFYTGPPHQFICGRQPWAEGILSFLRYDNDQTSGAPGANVWGYMLTGTLTDLSGTCRSRMVKVDVVRFYRVGPHAVLPDCAPACVETRVLTGPTAACVGR